MKLPSMGLTLYFLVFQCPDTGRVSGHWFDDVGYNGRISNGGVLGGCALQDALENRTSNITSLHHFPIQTSWLLIALWQIRHFL